MKQCVPLICAGLFCGAISVYLSFLKRYRSGEYPSLFPRFLGEFKRKKKRLRFSPLGVVVDFAFSILIGGYLVLFDATVLSGKGRVYHLFLFLGSMILSRWILSHPLGRMITFLFRFFCDLFRACFFALTFPFRILFRLSARFLSYLGLILKQKNDRIKKKRKAKRQIRIIRKEMTTAFLPPDFPGSLGKREKS